MKIEANAVFGLFRVKSGVLKFIFKYTQFFRGIKPIYFHFYQVTKLTALVWSAGFFVLCWLHLLFIFISACILIWIMQEVSEEEEGCERGVPHSMCPWLFFAPALFRVEQVGVGLLGWRERTCCAWCSRAGMPRLALSPPDCLLTWPALLSDLITVCKSNASCQPHSLH